MNPLKLMIVALPYFTMSDTVSGFPEWAGTIEQMIQHYRLKHNSIIRLTKDLSKNAEFKLYGQSGHHSGVLCFRLVGACRDYDAEFFPEGVDLLALLSESDTFAYWHRYKKCYVSKTEALAELRDARGSKWRNKPINVSDRRGYHWNQYGQEKSFYNWNSDIEHDQRMREYSNV